MTSIRCTLLPLTFAAVVLGAAPLAANPVLIARVDAEGIDAAAAQRLESVMREQARRVLGERLASAAPSRPASCADDNACAAALASANGANLVVLTTYAANGAELTLRARLHSADGRLVATAERSPTRPPDAREWRGVLHQLLSPGEYVGRLRFENAPAGAQISVDRLPLAASELLQPQAVRVGTHLVEVTAPDVAPIEREVTIAYDEELTFDASPPPPASASSPASSGHAAAVPWWPAAVTGSVMAVAAISALIAGADWAVTARDVDVLNAGLQRRDDDKLESHHYAVSLIPSEIQRRNLGPLRAAIRTDAVIVATAGSVAVVAGAATAAFLTRWVLGSSEPAPEANDAKEAP